jgi:glycine dehydrogenase subunit 1
MGELLDMDVVNVPTYDWCQAASTSVRMAGRITKRREILIVDTISPQRLAAMKNYCQPAMTIRMIKHDPKTGALDIEDLKNKLSEDTAGVYFENPSYLGFIETQGQAIADIVHDNRSLNIVGVDPVSLGVVKPPSQYGSDIVCGDIQGMGMHLNFGGGLAGFIATHDEEKFVMEYPSRLFGITRTAVEGEYGFGDVAYERTSFDGREEGKEFVGTHAALWGVTAGVYLSLMGPLGMYGLGKTILQKTQYAILLLSQLPGIQVPRFQSSCFKEFVVDFNQTGFKVSEINKALLEYQIFGGKDLSREFPDMGQCALYCVTEIHSQEKISKLAAALEEILHAGENSR